MVAIDAQVHLPAAAIFAVATAELISDPFGVCADAGTDIVIARMAPANGRIFRTVDMVNPLATGFTCETTGRFRLPLKNP